VSGACAPRHMFPQRKGNVLGGKYNVARGAQMTLSNICLGKSTRERKVLMTTNILKNCMLSRGADKSLAFPIFKTNKRIVLG
jgi:hypothetical protein